MQNCITSAFKIEPYDGSSWDLYIYPKRYCSTLEQLNTLMNPLGRICRSLENQDSLLEEGEWLIGFYGPFPTKYYEGIPELWDYHVIFKEDNVWKHRDGKGQPITEVSEDLFQYFRGHEIELQYFAVKKF